MNIDVFGGSEMKSQVWAVQWVQDIGLSHHILYDMYVLSNSIYQ